MKYLYICFILVSAIQASTDILTTADGPVVGWISSGNTAFLMKPGSPAVPEEIGYGYFQLRLSLCEDSDTDPVLMAVLGDIYWEENCTIKTFDLPDFSTVAQQTLAADEFYPPVYCAALKPPAVPRYISDLQERIAIIAVYTWYTDNSLVTDETYLTSCAVNPWSSSPINPVDTTNWIMSSAVHLSQFTSLVTDGSAFPFLLQTGASYNPMGPSSFNVNSIFLDCDTLAAEVLFSAQGNPDMDPRPTALALGMCDSGRIGLWNDSAAVVWSADFGGSPVSPELSQIDIEHGDLPFPAALTCSTDDDGILLAWYSGNEVVVRHWQGQWNSYSHVVESCGVVEMGNISVCSDTDGYWVVWLEESRREPEVRFIPRSTVTGIDAEYSYLPDGAAGFTVSPNPVRDQLVVNFSLPGVSEYQLSLFDISGRNVLDVSSGQGDEFAGIVSLETLPRGVYIMKLITPRLERSVLVVNVSK